MTAGRFFAEMTVIRRGLDWRRWPTFGVVKKDFPGAAVDFEAEEAPGAPGPAYESGKAWMYDTDAGRLWCPESMLSGQGQAWPGCTGAGRDGDRIGLLLDMDKGTIEVYGNDVRMGVMVRPGMAVDSFGEAVAVDDEEGTVIEPLATPVRSMP